MIHVNEILLLTIRDDIVKISQEKWDKISHMSNRNKGKVK